MRGCQDVAMWLLGYCEGLLGCCYVVNRVVGRLLLCGY